ncbi:MAG: hypothetical protein ACFE89_07990 [Candidatus Hodarchaeota archaeon]
MVLQSKPAKILLAVVGITIILIIIDLLLFQWENTTALLQGILTAFSVNPMLSYGVVIFVGGLGFVIASSLFYRRRRFKSSLRHELAEAERITLLDLAQQLEVTPARIEVELNRMASSKVTKFPGLFMISQGKHVYLGQKLLDRIVDSYNDGESRGDIASANQISRVELDKAIAQLVDSGLIEEREEKITRKVRPSYRRGSR